MTFWTGINKYIIVFIKRTGRKEAPSGKNHLFTSATEVKGRVFTDLTFCVFIEVIICSQRGISILPLYLNFCKHLKRYECNYK